MSVNDVAKGLVDKCRQGDFMGAVEEFYADDIVSVEPVGNDQMPAEIHGKDGVRGKNQWFADNMEVHGLEVDGPFVAEDGKFAVRYTMDVTDKNTGQRIQMTEMALYTVKDDKIAREQFFYNPGPQAQA